MVEVIKIVVIWNEIEFIVFEDNVFVIFEVICFKFMGIGVCLVFICDILKCIVLGLVGVKVEVVLVDEREGGLCNLFNFGYFIGYVYEVILIFQVLYGECVVIGMVREVEFVCFFGVFFFGVVVCLIKCIVSYELFIFFYDKCIVKLIVGKECFVDVFL